MTLYDENFYAKLQKEEEAEAKEIALALEGPDLPEGPDEDVEAYKEEREDYYADVHYAPAEGRVY